MATAASTPTSDNSRHVARSLLSVVTDPETPGDRVVFFQSASRLVAGDVNDVYDVYMWRNGELSLISTGGADAEHAIYKGNDRAGRNVFLTTRDSLTWQDVDAVADVYAARVGGGIPEPPEVVVCGVLGGVCQTGAGGSPDRAAPARGAGGANASPGAWKKVGIRGLGRKARRRAARTGRMRVRVSTNSAGVLVLGARVTLGGRSRKVAGARRRMGRPGSAVVGLRLNARARRVLGRGDRLRVVLRVALEGARTRKATVLLKRSR